MTPLVAIGWFALGAVIEWAVMRRRWERKVREAVQVERGAWSDSEESRIAGQVAQRGVEAQRAAELLDRERLHYSLTIELVEAGRCPVCLLHRHLVTFGKIRPEMTGRLTNQGTAYALPEHACKDTIQKPTEGMTK